tara:strand:- start:493 stop:606 length:114 start_codon:yes stop_codon:yes gene_type:complete
MKKKETKVAENVLLSWRKAMPYYYGVAWIILILIILL